MNTKKAIDNLQHWSTGIRFYVAVGIALASAEIWWWAQQAFSGELETIRLQEAYAWLSLGLLTTALTIGPLYKLAPKLAGKRIAFESRRMVGVGAAWFASLHVAIAYGALFNFENPLHVPSGFKVPFLLGVTALIILLIMAATSFDAAMKNLGIWWFRIHRLVYVAAIAALVHLYMIGVHAASGWVLLATNGAALALIAMHLAILQRTKPISFWRIASTTTAVLCLLLAGNYSVQQYLNKHVIVTGHEHHQ